MLPLTMNFLLVRYSRVGPSRITCANEATWREQAHKAQTSHGAKWARPVGTRHHLPQPPSASCMAGLHPKKAVNAHVRHSTLPLRWPHLPDRWRLPCAVLGPKRVRCKARFAGDGPVASGFAHLADHKSAPPHHEQQRCAAEERCVSPFGCRRLQLLRCINPKTRTHSLSMTQPLTDSRPYQRRKLRR